MVLLYPGKRKLISLKNNNKVVFFQIRAIKEKLIKLIQTAIYHFEKKENLLIYVQDDAALKFVDELLWKTPKEGFLPHIIADENTSDFIVITKSKNNLNKAKYLFNLSLDLVDFDPSYKVIYDFDDYTTEIKQQKSKKRFEIYRNAGFKIESY
ncbi:MAG: DNA polymerase III subunit chi [Candidatus Anoxychlamydiales bacterium]|nr:DNA polymerase III subunit chi [Candidatus Anoxychlamydiales bacterium]NGX35377.1 DNA polymerase III subunit chi [Candidatus Anoxychlamydiales bacterium]